MAHEHPKQRVVVWSTGTVGRHAIAGIDRHPDLELVGVWVSNPDKDGRDAGELADLGRELGVAATTDRDEAPGMTSRASCPGPGTGMPSPTSTCSTPPWPVWRPRPTSSCSSPVARRPVR